MALLPLTLLKEGKLASTVTQAATQVSRLLVHHSQSLHYYIIWQEMGPNESRQEDGNERVTAQKASPALSGRQLQAGTSDLTSFNMSEWCKERLSVPTCSKLCTCPFKGVLWVM